MEFTILTEPYDDDSLTFNTETARYELTKQYCKDNFEITFKNDGVLSRRIKRNSRVVYYYLYLHSHSNNYSVVNFFLHRTEEGRKYLLNVLTEQMEADLETGYNDIGKQPAINFANGQVLDRNEIQRNIVSVDTENVIYNSAIYLGFNLISQATLPPVLFTFVRDNE